MASTFERSSRHRTGLGGRPPARDWVADIAAPALSGVPLCSRKDLRGAMVEGTVVDVTHYTRPTLSGRTKVTVAQFRQWCLAYPDGHPDRSEGCCGFWIPAPGPDEVSFDQDGTATFYLPDGAPLLSLRVLEVSGRY